MSNGCSAQCESLSLIYRTTTQLLILIIFRSIKSTGREDELRYNQLKITANLHHFKMAKPERIGTKTSIICKPSSTQFFDMTLDCQQHFFCNVPLNQRLLLRAVCSQWKVLIEDSLKNIKKLRIFDGRQSLSDYAFTLARASLQCDHELSFCPYDTLILTTPKRLVEAEVLRAADEAAKKKVEKEDKAVDARTKKWLDKEKELLTKMEETKKRYEELVKMPEMSDSVIKEAENAVKKARKDYQSALNKHESTMASLPTTSSNHSHNRLDARADAQERREVQNLIMYQEEPIAAAAALLGLSRRVVRFEPLREEGEPPQAVLRQRLRVPDLERNVMRQRLFQRPFANRIVETRIPSQLKHKYTDISAFLAPLFPSVTSLAIWFKYIECTPCQADVAKLISAWKCTLQVLSVRIYASGLLEDYDGIEMNEYLLLRKKQLDAISKLPSLRRLHLGESEGAPNHFLPAAKRLSTDRVPRALLSCQLKLPPSVKLLSLNFRVFDSLSTKMFESLEVSNHLTELDVTYIRTSVSVPDICSLTLRLMLTTVLIL